MVFEAYSGFVNNFSIAMETAKKQARSKQVFEEFLKVGFVLWPRLAMALCSIVDSTNCCGKIAVCSSSITHHQKSTNLWFYKWISAITHF